MRLAVLSALANFALLLFAALVLGGGGHGLVEPAMFAASPFAWAGEFALVLAPLYWASAGYAAGKKRGWVFPAMALLGYLVGGVTAYREWREEVCNPYFHFDHVWQVLRAPALVWFAMFCLVQLALWLRWMTGPRHRAR